jgi:hypothetical protein
MIRGRGRKKRMREGLNGREEGRGEPMMAQASFKDSGRDVRSLQKL